MHQRINSAGAAMALWLSTLAFTLCFAAWTVLSVVGVRLQEELGLSASQLSLLVSIPVLMGSISRPVLGLLTQRFGGRWVMSITLFISAAFVYLLTLTDEYPMLVLIAFGLGLAGGTFAIGVAHVSSWFDRQHQGTALGIFGMGNVGSALTNLIGPFLLASMGWRGTAEVYALVLALMGLLFLAVGRNPPGETGRVASLTERIGPLLRLNVWRFSFYYFVNFGGFVALALWLPQFLMHVYHLSLASASMLTLFFTLPGSLGRGVGGWLADRFGARVIMYLTLSISLVCAFFLSYPPTEYSIQGISGDIFFFLGMGLWPFIGLVFILAIFMSIGMAAVFKLIPVAYPDDVGTVGGVVGMVGGLGGFFMPIAFGFLNNFTGLWQSCFMLIFMVTLIALLWMHGSILRTSGNSTS